MNDLQSTWSSDWPARLRRALHERGFETVSDFLERHPGESYVVVASRVGPWVVAMQLSRLQMEEAKLRGRVREAAMDAFVRELNERLPCGWIPDSATESRAAGAYAGATTLIEIDGDSPQFHRQMLDTYEALKRLEPPIGWRPGGPNDPLVRRAFDEGWPDG